MDVRLDLLQEYRRRRPAFSWRAAGFGFLLGVLVAAAAAMFFFRSAWLPGWLGGLGGSGPDEVEVVVNPDPDGQTAADADVVLHGDSSGHLGGEVKLSGGWPLAPVAPAAPSTTSPPVADHPAPGGREEPGNHSARLEIVDSRATSCADSERPPCPGGLHPGAVVEVPVEGVIHTVWIDSRTGEQVGAGDHPVEGMTTVAITDDLRLRVDTQFADSVEIAIDIPSQTPWWYIGGFAAASFSGLEAGAFVEYRLPLVEFPRLGCGVVAAAGAEMYRGSDGLGGRVAVRVGVAF